MGESYRRARILAFLHPWNDPLNTGYQTIQSQVSVASGGWFGVGLGASKAKWGFLAVRAHRLHLRHHQRGARPRRRHGSSSACSSPRLPRRPHRDCARADPFGRLLAIGITTWLCVQAFVNIGAVIGVLPITGVPLPFISFGGSSLLATMAGAGILLNVARTAPGFSR